MKLSPFTLIYQPEEGTAERSVERARISQSATSRVPSAQDRWHELRKKSPDLFKALKSFSPNLRNTLISSTFAQKSIDPSEQVPSKLRRVVRELQRSKEVVTVAIWDLDAKVDGLTEVMETLNKSQPVFTFFDLRAPVPAGLVIHSEFFTEWARRRMKFRVSKKEKANLRSNLMFNDFYDYARVVREQTGVDYLVGITRYKVAWEDGEDVYWDYFTTSDKGVILVSAYDMREYSSEAGRPLETAMAGMVIAQLLQELHKKALFHTENRGCLFDFNDERDTIVESIRAARIEDKCLMKIDAKYRDAARSMVKALKDYSPKREAAEKKKARKTSKDDEYWLEQLTKLSSKLSKGSGA
ncbi:MAG TPA: hypothetical protein VLM38_09490 [Blastocatellia bacterium]|nr:hypothetical protein [Blastocatellia bacterium]